MKLDVKRLMAGLGTLGAPRELTRVEECLSYLAGQRPLPAISDPHQQPTRLFFPGLSARAWHDTATMPWVAEFEGSYESILAEARGLLHTKARFVPYEDPYTLELGWAGWDTFSLYRKGKFIEENCARCPKTLAALERTPHGVRQAMFTLLAAGAHITPHSGGTNVLLTCHLGLIIPRDCALKVGDEARSWVPGRVTVFDDSFVHEAWNRSRDVRVVLLWDTWHPDLTAVEVRALTHLFPIFDRMMRGIEA